jgi:hypothetical protein
MITKIFFIAAFFGTVLSALTLAPGSVQAQQLLEAPDFLAPPAAPPAPATASELSFPTAEVVPAETDPFAETSPEMIRTTTTTETSTVTSTSTRTATPADLDALLGGGTEAPLTPSPLSFTGVDVTSPAAPSTRPEDTTADRIAMVYYKLAGQLPEFETWARNSEAFRNAGDFGRNEALDKEIARLRTVYRLTTLTDPVIVSKKMRLSRYNFKNRGFLVEGLDDRTFFASSFEGVDYALGAPKMAEYIWLPMASDEQALDIERSIDPGTREIILVAHMEPVFTDPQKTTPIDGRHYRLISSQLQDLSFYSAATGKRLWRLKDDADAAERRAQKEILELYR